MHTRFIILAAILCCSTLAAHVPPHFGWGSSSSSETWKIGDFEIIGFYKHDSFVLSNDVIYEPASHHDEKNSKHWKIHDPVQLLGTGKKHDFLLVNLRTGKTIKAHILDID